MLNWLYILFIGATLGGGATWLGPRDDTPEWVQAAGMLACIIGGAGLICAIGASFDNA